MKNPINCPVKDQSSRVKTIINNTRLRLQQGMANEKSNCNCNWHLPPFWFRPTLITWLTYDLKWAWPIWGRFKYRTLRDCCGRPINFICCIKTLWQTRLGLIVLLLIALNLGNIIKYYEETIYLLISSKMFFSWCHLNYYSELEFSLNISLTKKVLYKANYFRYIWGILWKTTHPKQNFNVILFVIFYVR